MFLPSDPNNAVSFTKFTDLLPEFQAALREAHTAAGWHPQKLNDGGRWRGNNLATLRSEES
jgi:hypothetical protein